MSSCRESPVLDDLDTIISRFTILTDSYRLLVGAAEELTRTPSANESIINDAMVRTAFCGNILDQLLVAIQLALIIDLVNLGPDQNPFT